MICPSCRVQHHALCKGGTWCDCQHGGTRKTIVIGGPYEPEPRTEPNGNR